MAVKRWTTAVVTAVLAIVVGVIPAGAVIGTGQAQPDVIGTSEPLYGATHNVSLVSHIAPGLKVGDPTPAGQYAALAIAGNCAFIGRRNYNSPDNADNGLGVQVVDISNPAAPRYIGTVPGSGFADSTARELRAVEQYHLLVVLHYTRYTGGGVQEAGGQVNTGGSNILQAFHIGRDCSTTPLANYNMGPVKPHEFYLWLDPNHAGRVIAYVTTPFGPPQMEVVDFSSCTSAGTTPPAACSPQLLTIWDGLYPQPNSAAIDNSGLGNYLHSLSVSPDGKTGYMAYWNGGFFTVDTSQVAAGAANPVIIGTATTSQRDDWSHQNGPTGQGGDAHSAVWVPTDLSRTSVKPYVVLSDEDYLGIGDCPFGWLRIDRVDQVAPGVTAATHVSSFGLPENLLTQEAAAVTFASRANAVVTDPGSCAGYNRDHPGFIGTSKVKPGWQIPANTYTSHNPTTLPDLVLTTWYGGGFRVIDISRPQKPAETGYFVPNPEPQVREELDDSSGQYLGCYYPVTPTATDPSNCTVRQGTAQNPVNYVVHPRVASWSYPIIKDGLIYFADNRNGLYVVKYDGPFDSEVEDTRFAEGNSNNTGRRPAAAAEVEKVATTSGATKSAPAAAPVAPVPAQVATAAQGVARVVSGQPASARWLAGIGVGVVALVLLAVVLTFSWWDRRAGARTGGEA